MYAEFSDLVGQTLKQCYTKGIPEDSIHFITTTNKHYRLFADDEMALCSLIYLEDICGELDDLVGSPIIQAEENSNNTNDGDQSQTWTFYRIATEKGQVVVRWYGTSNGYYSEQADFELIKP